MNKVVWDQILKCFSLYFSLCFSLDKYILQEVMLEFRAGKMFLEGKKVVPDTRKGLVRIVRVWYS